MPNWEGWMMKIQCLNSLFFIFISQNWLINFRNLYTLIRWFLLIWFILEIDLYFKLIAYQRMQYKIYILCFFVSYFFYCTLHRLIYKHIGIQENFVWRMCIMQSTWYILFIHMAYYLSFSFYVFPIMMKGYCSLLVIISLFS